MFKKISKILLVIATLFISTSAIAAETYKPAIVYNFGGKFDKSFGESAYKGVQKFMQETGIDVAEFEITNEAQSEQAIRKLAERSDLVIVVSFAFITPLQNAAPDFADTRFVIIDGVVEAPNVRSVLFKEHEGSFLVGNLAALASKTGKVGFVGGMDIPLIRKFELGYIEGVHYVNKDMEVIRNMTGTTPTAWNDPAKGAELASSQIDRGADVIFAAAGGTGAGVYQAAKDAGKLAIGVDSNQNYMHPGTMLTSMVKRVDVAVYNALKDGMGKEFSTGIQTLGLKEGGVDYALDEHNKNLLTEDMLKFVETSKEKIINGEIKVTNYMQQTAEK